VDINFITVITSAAVGGIMGSAINFVAQFLERRSRQKELILAKSIELATKRVQFVYDVAKESNANATLEDPGINCAIYYRWLTHLFEKGVLPSDAVHKEKSA
jgi:hypothetical protein